MVSQKQKNDKAVDIISQAIATAVEAYMRKAGFDITRQGIVTDVLDNNRYQLKIQGAEYTVPCCTEAIFKVGDNVLVLFVQGDFNRKYIIGRG